MTLVLARALLLRAQIDVLIGRRIVRLIYST